MKNYENVDAYIAAAAPGQQAALENLRLQILRSAPGVTEKIAWGVPLFKVNDKYVAGFAAYKHHISFTPWGGWSSLISESELEGFEHTPETIHLTPEQPLPDALVQRLVTLQIKANEAKAKAKKK